MTTFDTFLSLSNGLDPTFTYCAQELEEELLLTVSTVAYLSDGLRNVTSTHQVLYFEKPEAPSTTNTAPYFAVKVSDTYTRMKAQNLTADI